MTSGPAALRIAVDGASGAGKTTTARALGERLGRAVVSPDEATDGRTLLFDWMDYEGGRHRGAPIQTQVIAVPGHRQELRQAIIELADVVLFVADSTPSGIYDSAEAFRDLQSIRARLDPAPSIVVQANKRDAADAHDVDELRALLEVDDDVAVVETVAATGDGVRAAFVFAVRSGLSRLDELDGDAGRAGLSRDELEARLRALDGDPSPTERADPSGRTDPAGAARPTEPPVVEAAAADVPPPPATAPVEAIEIEIPPEDTANLESLRELLDPDAVAVAGEPVAVDPAPGSSDPRPESEPTAEAADAPALEARLEAAPSADGFAHLPPPPATGNDAGVTDQGRPSRWRRRKANAPEARR